MDLLGTPYLQIYILKLCISFSVYPWFQFIICRLMLLLLDCLNSRYTHFTISVWTVLVLQLNSLKMCVSVKSLPNFNIFYCKTNRSYLCYSAFMYMNINLHVACDSIESTSFIFTPWNSLSLFLQHWVSFLFFIALNSLSLNLQHLVSFT